MTFYFLNIIYYYNFGMMINMSSYLWFFYYYLYFFYNCSHSLLCWGDYYGFVGLKYLIFNLNYFVYLFSSNSFNLYMYMFLSL